MSQRSYATKLDPGAGSQRKKDDAPRPVPPVVAELGRARGGDGGEPAPTTSTRRSIRLSLHDEIAAELRRMILEGQLQPGERIPEAQFCSSFGISRTPLREALKVLAAEGLVELRPNRGGRVAEIHADEIAAIFEVMGALERLAGYLVCARISNAEIEELERMHAALVTLHRKGDRTGYFRQNQQIHRRIIALTENPVLLATYTSFAGKIARARYSANYDRIRWDESVREHEAIMRAIRARNSEVLSQRLEEHSIKTGRVVIGQLQNLQVAEPDRRRG